jgi:hypothetical protein
LIKKRKGKKIQLFFFLLQFLVIKTLDLYPDPEPYPDADSLEMFDPHREPDPDSMNPDPQH